MATMSIQQQPDGRHAVLNGNGQAVGLHNSMRSAQRQLEDYYTPPAPAPAGGQPTGPGNQAQGEAASTPSTALTSAQSAMMAPQMGSAQTPQYTGMNPMGQLAEAAMSQTGHPAQAAMQAQAQAQQAQAQAHANQLAGIQAGQQTAAHVLANTLGPNATNPQTVQNAINAQRVQGLANGAMQPAGGPPNAAQLQAAYNAFHPQSQMGGPGAVSLGMSPLAAVTLGHAPVMTPGGGAGGAPPSPGTTMTPGAPGGPPRAGVMQPLVH
jgi:hypothetical protein